MKYAFRNFRCASAKCGKLFTDFVETTDGTVKYNGREIPAHHLPCPFCNQKNNVMMVPKYHTTVSKGVAKSTDQRLDAIATRYGMTDMNNSGGKAAMPMTAPPPPAMPEQNTGTMYTPMPGFSVPFTGQPHAGWSNAPPQASVKAKTHTSVAAGTKVPTQVVGRAQ